MELKKARKIAEEVKGWLEPYCEPGRCVIAGSIRRQKAKVGDVELLCIPNPYCPFIDWSHTSYSDNLDVQIQRLMKKKLIDYRLNSKGSKVYGPKNKLLIHEASGFPIDIFSTDEECWATALVVRTGSKQNNIRIAMAAKKKGWRFNAYGSGFSRICPNCHGEKTLYSGIGELSRCPFCHGTGNEKIICKTEREVFEAVGLEYKEPEER